MNALRVPVVSLLALFTSLPLLLNPESCRAQSARSGDRVRMEYTGGELDGQFISADDNVIVVDTGGSGPISIQKQSITQLERLDGKRRNWRWGLLIGAGTGAALGGILTAADSDDEDWSSGNFLVGSYAVVGAVAGAAIGALIQTDRWTEIPLDDNMKLGIEPYQKNGVALSLAWNY